MSLWNCRQFLNRDFFVSLSLSHAQRVRRCCGLPTLEQIDISAQSLKCDYSTADIFSGPINNSVFCSLFAIRRSSTYSLHWHFVTNSAAANLRFSAYKSTEARRLPVCMRVHFIWIKHSRIVEIGHSSFNEYLLAIYIWTLVTCGLVHTA